MLDFEPMVRSHVLFLAPVLLLLIALVAAPVSSDLSTRRERADARVKRLVEAINGGDADLLHPGQTLDERTRNQVREGLEGWRHFLGGKPVERFVFVEESGNPGASTLAYELVAAGGRRKRVEVTYNGRVDEVHLHDEFLDIYPRANSLVRGVIESLKSGDARALARQLTPDDEPFSPEKAEQMIARYRREIDVATLAFRFQDLKNTLENTPGEEHNDFVYLLEGEKDGRPVRHTVRVGHGDGLVWWIDPYTPQ